MKYLFSTLTLIAASLFSSSNSQAQTQPITTVKTHSIDDFYRYVGPDLDLQGGLGYHWNTSTTTHTPDQLYGMGRLRMGVLDVVGYPWAIALGPTFEINTLTSPVWGGQVEIMNFGAGLWLRGGAGIDYQMHPHFNAAVGWSVIGIEVSGFNASSFDSRQGVEVLCVLRIPVGFIGYVFSKQH